MARSTVEKKNLKGKKSSDNLKKIDKKSPGSIKANRSVEKKKSKSALKEELKEKENGSIEKKSRSALKEKHKDKENVTDRTKDDDLSSTTGHAKDEMIRESLDTDHRKNSKKKNSSKKRSRSEKENIVDSNEDEGNTVDGVPDCDMLEAKPSKMSIDSQIVKQARSSKKHKESKSVTVVKTKKIKKEHSIRKKESQITARKNEAFTEVAEKVDVISSVDDDSSRGMKKWLIKYKESRPGLDVLQERIDDFITTYEEQQKQEKEAREALAAEGGWTVVVHNKGRKKTTDAESGITVGSVAPAAVLDKMGKKKNKEAVVDFYRFQKREAKRNEVMMLQSKFEQDKKRIQELRAARKFRPY